MRVTFIYSDLFPTFLNWPGHFYTGVALLSAVLKRGGHQTSLIHVTQRIRKEDFLRRLSSLSPDLIAFSSTTLTFKYVAEMAGWLKESGNTIPVISGGVHATLFPSDVISTAGIDMICVGEGENALLALCSAIEKGESVTGIPGIWVKQGEEIVENGVAEAVRDLDTLPFADRSIFDYGNLAKERDGIATIMGSRGCPYHCTYCSNRAIKDTLFGGRTKSYVRFRSVDNVLDELRQVLHDYPFIHSFWFDDDLFFLHKEWAEEFTAKYSAQINKPFICNMRPNHMTWEIVSLLKRAGCMQVRMGLESGNERIRNEVLQRNLTDEQMKEAFSFCHKLGIKTHSYNIVGIPGETAAEILDTIKMNVQVKSDSMQVSIFYPMPKTHLFDLCKEKGYVVEDSEGYDFFSSMLDIGTISQKKISYFFKNFKLLAKAYAAAFRCGPASNVVSGFLDWLFKGPMLNLMGGVLSVLRKARSRFTSSRAQAPDIKASHAE